MLFWATKYLMIIAIVLHSLMGAHGHCCSEMIPTIESPSAPEIQNRVVIDRCFDFFCHFNHGCLDELSTLHYHEMDNGHSQHEHELCHYCLEYAVPVKKASFDIGFVKIFVQFLLNLFVLPENEFFSVSNNFSFENTKIILSTSGIRLHLFLEHFRN